MKTKQEIEEEIDRVKIEAADCIKSGHIDEAIKKQNYLFGLMFCLEENKEDEQ